MVLVGVAGGAASGKTTVCDMIIEQLRDQRVVLVNQVIATTIYSWMDQHQFMCLQIHACVSIVNKGINFMRDDG